MLLLWFLPCWLSKVDLSTRNVDSTYVRKRVSPLACGQQQQQQQHPILHPIPHASPPAHQSISLLRDNSQAPLPSFRSNPKVSNDDIEIVGRMRRWNLYVVYRIWFPGCISVSWFVISDGTASMLSLRLLLSVRQKTWLVAAFLTAVILVQKPWARLALLP